MASSESLQSTTIPEPSTSTATPSSPPPHVSDLPLPSRPVPTAALILAGGPATRMGYPKHLLKLPNGHPLYLHVANLVHQACPHLSCIYISLAEGSYLDEDIRAHLNAHPGRPAHHKPSVTTINADNTASDAAVIGLDPNKAQQHDDLHLQVIWDKRTPILYPPPTRAQQRREEKKRSRERPEQRSHKNRSTSSSKRQAGRVSDASTGTAPTTPVSESGGGIPHGYGLAWAEQDGDVDALGGVPAFASGGTENYSSGPDPSGNAGGGPIRGFLAAHEAMPDATWLIIACDYPRITTSAIQYLIEAYEPPVTCFRGARNKMEPLVSIWSPEALAQLKQNCDPAYIAATSATEGTGPSSTMASPVTRVGMQLDEMDLSGDGMSPPPQPPSLTDTGEASAVPRSMQSAAGGSSGATTPARQAATLGILGTIRQLQGKAVEVPPGGVDDIWMYNVNTPGNWDTALELYDE